MRTNCGEENELKYCSSKDMVADMPTKGLSKLQFVKLRNMAGVKDMSDGECRGVSKITL